MKVGAVNADEHKDLNGRFQIRGFPTIKIFGVKKNKPDDYNGARTAQGLVDAALAAIKSKVNANMGGKSGGSNSKVIINYFSINNLQVKKNSFSNLIRQMSWN